MDSDGSSKPEGAHAQFAGLVAGEAGFFPSLESAEEVTEGPVQVPQGFLGGAFGDPIHPGEAGLF